MKERYFVIHASEDGLSVEDMTADELTKRLAANYYGEEARAPKWANEIQSGDPYEWCGYSVIIKGTIVQPKPVDVVKVWEVP